MKWSFFKRSLSLVGDMNLALPPAQYHHGALHLFSSLAKSSPVTGE